MTCRLTFTVECVAAMMYQLTPTKFMPLPKSETNMATKKKRKPRCAQISFQSTGVVTAVVMGTSEPSILAASRDSRRGDGKGCVQHAAKRLSLARFSLFPGVKRCILSRIVTGLESEPWGTK